MNIRPLIASDYTQVAAIYKKGLATGIATFETEIPDWNSWNLKFLDACRFVLVIDDNIIGWCALSPVSKRKVYQGVAEDTIYLDPEYQGKNLGKILLQHLISESKKNGFWTLQAAIFSQNKSSIALHKSCGFREIGFREKIAKRDGLMYIRIADLPDSTVKPVMEEFQAELEKKYGSYKGEEE